MKHQDCCWPHYQMKWRGVWQNPYSPFKLDKQTYIWTTIYGLPAPTICLKNWVQVILLNLDILAPIFGWMKFRRYLVSNTAKESRFESLCCCLHKDLSVTIAYQPSRAGGTHSPPATPATPKLLDPPINFRKISFFVWSFLRTSKIQNGRQGAPKWPTGSGNGFTPTL